MNARQQGFPPYRDHQGQPYQTAPPPHYNKDNCCYQSHSIPLAPPPPPPPVLRHRYAPPPPPPPGVGSYIPTVGHSWKPPVQSPIPPCAYRPPGDGFWRPPPGLDVNQQWSSHEQQQQSKPVGGGRSNGVIPARNGPPQFERGKETDVLVHKSYSDQAAAVVVVEKGGERESETCSQGQEVTSSTVNIIELDRLLKHLLQPLFCKICDTKLNSPVQSMQHYDGRNHAKKLNMYISERQAKMDQSSIDPATEHPADAATVSDSVPVISDSAINSTTTGNGERNMKTKTTRLNEMKPISNESINTKDESTCSPDDKKKVPAEEYCELCDASFNSPKQAEQHYQGKNHAKKLRLSAMANVPLNCDSSIAAGQGSKYTCFVCNVHVTSQEQLTSHLSGSRHKAKIRVQQRGSNALRGRWSNKQNSNRSSTCSLGAGGTSGGLAPGIRYEASGQDYQSGVLDHQGFMYQPSPAKKSRRDFSNYRTPSGKYYCSQCNVTLNSEGQIAQHMESKRHKSNSSMHRSYLDSGDYT